MTLPAEAILRNYWRRRSDMLPLLALLLDLGIEVVSASLSMVTYLRRNCAGSAFYRLRLSREVARRTDFFSGVSIRSTHRAHTLLKPSALVITWWVVPDDNFRHAATYPPISCNHVIDMPNIFIRAHIYRAARTVLVFSRLSTTLKLRNPLINCSIRQCIVSKN